MSPIRIVIADDHAIFRNGFKLLLKGQKEIELVGEAESGKEVVKLVHRLQPDVVLVDIKMPEGNGIEACRLIKEAFPLTGVIALTTFDEDYFIVDILDAGAGGYLLKNTTRSELHNAIQTVHSGGTYYSPVIAKKIVHLQSQRKFAFGKAKQRIQFTERELSVMKLVCDQLTNKEIASKLGLSSRTVESHREKIQEKIGSKNGAGIALYAIQHNLFPS